MTRRLWLAGPALVLAVALVWTLPPRPDALPEGYVPAGHVRGVVHIHTRRSDGGGTVDDVARAAARAGLRFVVVTDHGDGTRPPDPPAYRHGVLVIDAVEVTTFDGHVVALGIGEAPYRLGGRGEDVVDDINRLGGFAIAAHVDSPKRSLRWRAWDADLAGFEWLNGDSEWRDESRASLLPLLVQYPLRAPEALARVLDRPEVTLARWDGQLSTRRLITIPAADAHARVGGSEEDDPRWWRRLALPIPGYEPLFKAFSLVTTGVELTGQAEADAAAVLRAIRAGHGYSVVDALASHSWLRVEATGSGLAAGPGDALRVADGASVRIGVRVPDVPGVRIRVMKDGIAVRQANGAALDVDLPPGTTGAYRVEVDRAGAPGQPPVPWILSNPIFVGRDEAWGRLPVPPAPEVRDARVLVSRDWAGERSERSAVAIDHVRVPAGDAALVRFALSGTPSSGPFAAAAMPVDGVRGVDAVRLTLRASRPMRVSVELRGRTPGGEDGRWRRSVYVDTESRTAVVPFDTLRPASANQPPLPEAGSVRSLMLVVDGVNSAPGEAGQIWIESAALAVRPEPSGPNRQ